MSQFRKRFNVKHFTIAEAVASLPPATPWNRTLVAADLFIGASGFEERILAVPNAIKRICTPINGTCLLGQYRTNHADNQNRLIELQPVLECTGERIVFFDADDSILTKTAIDTELLALEGGDERHVVFDISGASAKLIFSTMAALLASPTSVKLTIFYTEAVQYHAPDPLKRNIPVLDWGDEDQREYGVAEVDYNELYQGMHQDHLPGYVLAFPSMFPNRLQRCLSHLDVGPLSGAEQNVHWIIPSTINVGHQWRSEQIKKCLVDIFYRDSEEPSQKTTLPCNSYSECDVIDYTQSTAIVMEQIEKRGGATNLSLIHMGTKLQAIGAAIALAARPEVALVSSRPNSFAAHRYSYGTGQIWTIQFPSQKLALEPLAKIGTLEII